MGEHSGANQRANGAVLSFDAASPTPARDAKHPLLTWWPVVLVVLALAVAAGEMRSTVQTNSEHIREIKDDVRSIAVRLGVQQANP